MTSSLSLEHFYWGKQVQGSGSNGGYLVTASTPHTVTQSMKRLTDLSSPGDHDGYDPEKMLDTSLIYVMDDDHVQIWRQWVLTKIYDRGYRLPVSHIAFAQLAQTHKLRLTPMHVMQAFTQEPFEPIQGGDLTPIKVGSASQAKQAAATDDETQSSQTDELAQALARVIDGVAAALVFDKKVLIINAPRDLGVRLEVIAEILDSIPDALKPYISFATQSFDAADCACMIQFPLTHARMEQNLLFNWESGWETLPPRTYAGEVLRAAIMGNRVPLERVIPQLEAMLKTANWRQQIELACLESLIDTAANWKDFSPTDIILYVENHPNSSKKADYLFWAMQSISASSDEKDIDLLDRAADIGLIFEPALAGVFTKPETAIPLLRRWTTYPDSFLGRFARFQSAKFLSSGELFARDGELFGSILELLHRSPEHYLNFGDWVKALDSTSENHLLDLLRFAPPTLKEVFLAQLWDDPRVGHSHSERLTRLQSACAYTYVAAPAGWFRAGQSVEQASTALTTTREILEWLAKLSSEPVELPAFPISLSEIERQQYGDALRNLLRFMVVESGGIWRRGREIKLSPKLAEAVDSLRRMLAAWDQEANQ